MTLKFRRELYNKAALIKAAYNFTDIAYVHLDADADYYYVDIESKAPDKAISEKELINEMLTQSVRHEVYQQTKNIRKLLLARALSTSLIVDEDLLDDNEPSEKFSDSDILRDWFGSHEKD